MSASRLNHLSNEDVTGPRRKWHALAETEESEWFDWAREFVAMYASLAESKAREDSTRAADLVITIDADQIICGSDWYRSASLEGSAFFFLQERFPMHGFHQWNKGISLLISTSDSRKEDRRGKDARQYVGDLLSNFMDIALRLETQGHTESALDVIYDTVDELLHHGRYTLCATILREIDVADYSADLLLALLTTTLPAKIHLSSRNEFFDRVRQTLLDRGEDASLVLAGLE